MAFFQQLSYIAVGNTATPTTIDPELIGVRIDRTRPTVTVGPTSRYNYVRNYAGALSETITLKYFGTPEEAQGTWRLIMNAIESDSGELFLAFKVKEGATSSTNEVYICTALVTDHSIGAMPDEVWEFEVTWPLKQPHSRSTNQTLGS
jgi:hypothetical protein